MKFTRITVDPGQMGGVPCVRGLRISVATVVGMVAEGFSTAEILDELPDLVPEDVRECLRFAAAAVNERELPFRDVSWSRTSEVGCIAVFSHPRLRVRALPILP